MTRFLVLSREPLITQPGDARPYKTSIVFSMPERAGQLFKARMQSCWERTGAAGAQSRWRA